MPLRLTTMKQRRKKQQSVQALEGEMVWGLEHWGQKTIDGHRWRKTMQLFVAALAMREGPG